MLIPVGICFDITGCQNYSETVTLICYSYSSQMILFVSSVKNVFNTQFHAERKVKVSKRGERGEREGGLTWDSSQAGKSFMQAGEVQS